MKRTTNMGPPRLLVVASTSSCVRINLFGIDETLKPGIVTATLSENDPPRGPGSIGYLFDLSDDTRNFLVHREEVDDSLTTIVRPSLQRRMRILYGSEWRSSGIVGRPAPILRHRHYPIPNSSKGSRSNRFRW